jgi:DNA-binding MarR family transcriptional regulator
MEEKLAQFDELFRKVHTIKNHISDHNCFSRQQMLLLITLMRKKKTTVGDLAEELGLSTSAMTIAINRLVKSGHISRTRDESDRRVVWVELSDSAKQSISRLKEIRDQFLIRMLDELSPDEQDQFIGLLRKMTKALTLND